MLPTTADNGARLAAILPSGIAAVARGLATTLPEELRYADADSLPALRSFVMIVVDGLGSANLAARAGHAPALARLPRKRIETVAPSTTGAALTTLLTGRLPGEHGLIGYRIRHPELGLVTTLRDWQGIGDPRAWQHATPLLTHASSIGARAVAIGRPAHATGGLTEAILAGAEYLGGQRIEDRFALASRVLREQTPAIVYLYIDELDKAGHEHGWQGEQWGRRLEQFDASLEGFLRSLPGDVGIAITADHGMVDVAPHQQIMLEADPALLDGVAAIGGEPRFRSLYLHEGVDAEAISRAWQEAEGSRAWVGTRAELIANGSFGPVRPGVEERLGDVLIAARKQVAYYTSTEDPRVLTMVGQHGSFTDEERGVPLALGGALVGTRFAAAVQATANSRSPH
ncbi:nucleotide pyrophosphatase/phosphodiesterase family protein [Leucobacter sp. NPDC077196]|uniref:alkaline phosphatase family protein n=1 Tax=Leucobacter sp. NPDC077196 TaxID=3154959 RepID=UPI00341503E4